METISHSSSNVCDDFYFILCKNIDNDLYIAYSNIFVNKNIYFIVDNKPSMKNNYENIIYYSNSLVERCGFTNSHSKLKITSWDKVFYHIKVNNLMKHYCWFIEDDCYINKNKANVVFSDLNNIKCDLLLFGWHKTFHNDIKWPHWNKTSYFSKNHLSSSINQIVRLSPRLLSKILEIQNRIKRMLFHELFFASVAKQNNYKIHLSHSTDIHICALYKNSLLYKKYNGVLNKEVLNDINKNYSMIHPLKQWYKYY